MNEIAEHREGFVIVTEDGDFLLPGRVCAEEKLPEADFIAEVLERRVEVRARLVGHGERFGGDNHLTGDDGVHAEAFEAGAEVAFEQIKSDEDHRGDGDEQASHKDAGEDATRLFQPARPGVLPKVGSD